MHIVWFVGNLGLCIFGGLGVVLITLVSIRRALDLYLYKEGIILPGETLGEAIERYEKG